MAQHRRKARKSTVARRAVLVVAGVVAGIAALYFGAIIAVGDGVRAGTTVAGIEVGGMSTAEAVEALDATIGKRVAKPVRVRAKEQAFVVRPADAGIAFDARATLAQVSGRTWNPITLIGDLIGGRAVEPVITVDDAALGGQVEGIATAVDHPAIEPTLTMKGSTPKLRPGRDGHVLDQATLRTQIVEAVGKARKPIPAPIDVSPPTVGPAAAEAAVDLARNAVSAPVIVSAGNVTAVIPSNAIAEALTFSVVDGELEPRLDGATLHAAIAPDLAEVETPGRDATFRIKKGRPVVVPSVVGTGIADDELAAQVSTVLDKQTPDRAVSVSLGVREPKLTTAQAEALGVTERLSTFTQKFPYAAYRVQNIGQAARNVNGTLLMPGETFSMNDTMGERTERNGYTKGFVVGPGGVFAEDLGGGVSAATTTVWTGAFFAGMERVFTQAHSIYISRYQPGLEATVAWGIFDMKFRNDTPYGVFITTKMTNTSMTVNFWGTRIYDEIDAEFGPKREIRPFPTIHDTSKACLGQSGMDGFTIDVDRVFYQGGKEVKRETITTRYRAAPKVVCGKKKKPGEQVDGGASPSPSPSGLASGAPVVDGPPDPGASSASSAPSPTPTKKPGRKPKPT